MAVVALPLLTDLGATPHYTFATELEGVTYTFEFLWDDRDGAWYMQIGDGEENPLTGMVRVVLGASLLSQFSNAALPPGQFIVKDTSGQDLDAGLADLGSRVQVWYVDSASVANLQATGSF